MSEYRFEGNRFSFYPIRECDLEWARALHNDPEVLDMLTDPHEVGEAQQNAWFRALVHDRRRRRIVVAKENDRVGLIRLDQIDVDNKSVCVGMDIVKQFRGQGMAKPIYEELIKYLFSSGFHRLWLLVASYNDRARHIYRGLGFKEEGAQREALYKNNQYFDYVMMGLLQNERST